jgi:hypothetical protein
MPHPIRIFRAFCERLTRQENERLEQELREARSTIRVLELEQEKFLDVIERDRQRVHAERRRYVAAGEKAVKAADDHASDASQQ